MSTLKTYSYSLCVVLPDPARGERLNLGVIVVSDEEQRSKGEFLSRFKSRLRSLAPDCNADAVADIVSTLGLRVGDGHQRRLGADTEDDDLLIRRTAQLSAASAVMKNQVQLSGTRKYRAETLEDAVAELFRSYVAPTPNVRPQAAGMSLRQLQSLIRHTVKRWGGEVVRIQEKGLEAAHGTRHFADFWIETGSPIAALIAIPEEPGERDQAWARRDSVPTIAREFLAVNERFRAIAVFPPNGHAPTPFVVETKQFLRDMPGVLVVHADHLDSLRDDILPRLGQSTPL